MPSVCRLARIKRVCATIDDWSARYLLGFWVPRTTGIDRALLGGVLGQLVARAPLLMTAAGS